MYNVYHQQFSLECFHGIVFFYDTLVAALWRAFGNKGFFPFL